MVSSDIAAANGDNPAPTIFKSLAKIVEGGRSASPTAASNSASGSTSGPASGAASGSASGSATTVTPSPAKAAEQGRPGEYSHSVRHAPNLAQQ